jgi:2'-5' RNA ligase
MKNKIFISIDIPKKFKKRMVLETQKWQDLPMKWMKETSLHITLVFLGFVDEEVIFEICEKVRQACENENIFDIEFDQIELFPSVDEPRTIALTGKPSEELRDLVNSIEKELGISTSPKKSFRPHITLGRTKKYKWEELENKPSISQKFSLTIPVENVDIVSSKTDKSTGEYTVLESCPLI